MIFVLFPMAGSILFVHFAPCVFVFRWLVRLWNAVIVPRVEDAVISRVTAKRSPSQRRSPNNKGLSPGQRAVVKAALNILLNKAVLQGCPLPRTGTAPSNMLPLIELH